MMAATTFTLFLIATYQELQMISAISAKLEWTYHIADASWNIGNEVCRENGSLLIKLDTELKWSVANHFHTTSWSGEGGTKYWTGLHKTTASEGFGDYSWADCSPLDDTVTNWRHRTGTRDTRRCVMVIANTEQWDIAFCHWGLDFICEKTIGNCTFDEIGNSAVEHLDSNREISQESQTVSNREECYTLCLGNTTTGTECIAYTYTTSTSLCEVYFSGEHTDALTISTVSAAGSISFIKTCFVGKIIKNTVPAGQIDDSEVPDSGCEPVLPVTDAQPSPGEQQTSTNISMLTTLPTTQPPSTNEDQQISTSPRISHETWTTGLQTSTNISPLTSLPTTQPSSTDGEQQISTSPRTSPETSTTGLQLCPCPCSTKLTENESKAFMGKIINNLNIDTEKISSRRRKYVSAPDERPSARQMGGLGIALLSFVFGGLVLLDLKRLFADAKKLYTTMKELFMSIKK